MRKLSLLVINPQLIITFLCSFVVVLHLSSHCFLTAYTFNGLVHSHLSDQFCFQAAVFNENSDELTARHLPRTEQQNDNVISLPVNIVDSHTTFTYQKAA